MPQSSAPLPDRARAALRQILLEAAAARAALCENELIIRLDNIMALAEGALAEGALNASPPDA